MGEIILMIIAMAVVCSALCGIAAYAWTEVAERKMKKRIKALEERVSMLIDANAARAMRSMMLESDFDRLIEEKFPELWPEFSIKDPEDRMRYREAAKKMSISISSNTKEAAEKLNGIHRDVTEALGSIGKVKEEFKIEDYPFGRTNLARDIGSIEKEQSSRRLKEELKPEQYYEELMEPLVLAIYPDQIGSMKRGSLDWIREVLYDIRRKVKTATGLRKEALKRAIEFCEGLLAEPGPAKPQDIDYQHEITVAMRFLSERLTHKNILKKWDPIFHRGAIGWDEVWHVLTLAKQGKLAPWIQHEYNIHKSPLEQIDTEKEDSHVG